METAKKHVKVLSVHAWQGDTSALLLRPMGVRAVHPLVGGLWAPGISTRPENQELVARVNVLVGRRSHVHREPLLFQSDLSPTSRTILIL